MGLFASGDIDIKGTHFIAANLYSKGYVFFPASGNGVLIGGVLANDPLLVRGNARIYFNEPESFVHPWRSVRGPRRPPAYCLPRMDLSSLCACSCVCP